MSSTVGHFCLWGDFDADEVVKTLGLMPSSVIRKGDIWEDGGVPSPGASLDFYCPEDTSAQEQIEFLLTLLWPLREPLQKLTTQFVGDMNVCADQPQLLALAPEASQKLASLNIRLNCFCGLGEDDNDAN
jgi:hypothetical protein